LLPAHPPHHESSSGETTGDGITKVLMDEPKVNNSTFDRFQQQQQPGIDPSSPSVDDQYTLLIRQVSSDGCDPLIPCPPRFISLGFLLDGRDPP